MVGARTVAVCVILCGSISVCWSQLAMMGMMGFGDMTPAEHAFLDNAVKYIVGPHASADMPLITLARQQGGPPITMMQLMSYVGLLQSLGQRIGVAGVPRRPVLPTTGNLTLAQISQLMTPLPTPNDVVMQRAVEWFNQNQMALTSGGMMF